MGDLPLGSVVAGLRIDAVAGRGGMGVVYKAYDPRLLRHIALKVIADDLAADPEFRERFRREAQAAARVEHPHVVSVHWTDTDAGRTYLAMQHIEGDDLRELITRDGRVAPATAVEIVEQVGSALDATHALGLVHRDVKPANVLVRSTSTGPHAYLTDFGLTRPADVSRQLTGTGLVVGTEAYMAPELFVGGRAGVATDVYALGGVLFHALTGRLYPRGTGGDPSMRADLGDPALAAALDPVVARAMSVDPGRRHRSAGALAAAAAEALRAGAGGVARTALQAERTDTAPPPPGRPTPSGPVYLPVAPTDQSPVRVPEPGPRGPVYAPVPHHGLVPPPVLPATLQAPRPAVPRRGVLPVAAAVVAVVLVLVAGALVLPDLLDRDGATAAGGVVLEPVADLGSSVRLRWSGPPGANYGVEVAEDGGAATTTLAGTATTSTVEVDPARRYCFTIRATDGTTITDSNVEAIRGATCLRA